MGSKSCKVFDSNLIRNSGSKSLLCMLALFVTLWTVAQQVSLSMGLSRQEYWSTLPCLLPGRVSQRGTFQIRISDEAKKLLNMFGVKTLISCNSDRYRYAQRKRNQIVCFLRNLINNSVSSLCLLFTCFQKDFFFVFQ